MDDGALGLRRWVCFDVGEVLIDETRVWSTWADVLGVPRLTFMAVLGALIASGEDHEGVFARLGFADWRSREAEVRSVYGGFAVGDLYPDALPALDAVRSAGFSVAVIANQPAERHAELEALGVRPDVMAMSEALGVSKPSPAFFARVLELLDAAPDDVLYVGDRVDNDVIPAAAAGVRVAWLRRGPWGLLQRDRDRIATLEVDSLRELAGRLT